MPSDAQQVITKGSTDKAVREKKDDKRFADQLLGWIESGDSSHPRLIKITPAKARIMLRWNNRNRRISKSRLRRFIKDMQDGEWRFTGDTIQFSTERLLNGQHRLQACIESGKSFESFVVFGVDDDSFAYMDIGGVRTAADVFGIHGVKNPLNVASAVRFLHAYDSGITIGRDGRISAQGRTTNAELYRLFDEKYRDLEKTSSILYGFANHCRLAPASLMYALHYICWRKNQKQANTFFAKIYSGLNFDGRDDPAYKLYQRLVENHGALEKISKLTIAMLTIKAWNGMRQGRSIGILAVRKKEKFPEAL